MTPIARFREASPIDTLLARRASERGMSLALGDRHRSYTYAELRDRVTRVATVLTSLGVEPGDRVAVSLPSCTEVAVLFFACVRLGAVWVGISPRLTAAELAYAIGRVRPALLIGSPTVVELMTATSLGADVPTCAVCDPEHAALGPWGEETATRQVVPQDSMTQPRTLADSAIQWSDRPLAISFTSGTTSLPKAVLHSEASMLPPAVHRVASHTFGPAPSIGVCLPLTSLNLLILGPLTALVAGSPCQVTERLDADGVLELLRRARPDSVSIPAPILRDLLSDPSVDENAFREMAPLTTGGGACPDDLKMEFSKRFGVEVLRTYGLSEAPSVVCLEQPGASLVPGSSGRPLPYLKLRITGDDGAEVAPTSAGQICVTAGASPAAGMPRYRPMLGYWDDPAASAAALQDGMLHTGDRGWLDGTGNLFVEGRGGAVIVRGGANIAVAEVELVLMSHPEVRRCAVVRLPDPRLGSVVGALVESASTDAGLADRIRAHCLPRLGRHKVPVRIWCLAALPSAAAQKVDRSAAQAMADELVANQELTVQLTDKWEAR